MAKEQKAIAEAIETKALELPDDCEVHAHKGCVRIGNFRARFMPTKVAAMSTAAKFRKGCTIKRTGTGGRTHDEGSEIEDKARAYADFCRSNGRKRVILWPPGKGPNATENKWAAAVLIAIYGGKPRDYRQGGDSRSNREYLERKLTEDGWAIIYADPAERRLSDDERAAGKG